MPPLETLLDRHTGDLDEHGGVLFRKVGYRKIYVGFEVLTAVAIMSSICWNITPCSQVNRCLFHAGFFLGLLFDLDDGRSDIFIRNVN
jgi:hypothetical protein